MNNTRFLNSRDRAAAWLLATSLAVSASLLSAQSSTSGSSGTSGSKQSSQPGSSSSTGTSAQGSGSMSGQNTGDSATRGTSESTRTGAPDTDRRGPPTGTDPSAQGTSGTRSGAASSKTPRNFDSLDSNRDGSLSISEFRGQIETGSFDNIPGGTSRAGSTAGSPGSSAGIASSGTPGAAGSPGTVPSAADQFKRLDTDGDGKLSRSEFFQAQGNTGQSR